MAKKNKDFLGSSVAEAIKQACADFSVSQDDLEINVLETGSMGIFGLCKKKAHIQVSLKEKFRKDEVDPAGKKKSEKKKSSGDQQKDSPSSQNVKVVKPAEESSPGKKEEADKESEKSLQSSSEGEVKEMPTVETLESIRVDIEKILDLMGFSSQVQVDTKDYTVQGAISGEHEEDIIGVEGRTLDSLQYLIRKMVNRRLPERMPLYLDAGNYRERRVDELCERARNLAIQVKEDGKTQAIPALNPSERRVVHMALQEDKDIRSRSVGDGLFKKVLIYKPGKGQKSGQRNRRGRRSGRPTNKQE